MPMARRRGLQSWVSLTLHDSEVHVVRYVVSKLKVLQECKSVMLSNVFVKNNNCLTLTTKSRISKVRDVKVSSERQKAARGIALPPMPSVVPLKDIEKSSI